MSNERCRIWIERAVDQLLRDTNGATDSGTFLASVPPECTDAVERLLTRIGYARETHVQQDDAMLWSGEYGEIDFLGRGGMGGVYLAKNSQGLVAIKIPQGINLQHFYSEIWNHVLVPSHPCLVNWRYLRKFGATPGIVMEFMEQGSLHVRLKDLLGYDSEQWTRDFFDVGIQACWALRHLHSQGLVHQDIKPANILFRSVEANVSDNAYRIGLGDLGVSRFLRSDTGQAEVVGFDQRFAAPEQVEGHQASTATDIYCLGKTLRQFFDLRLGADIASDSAWAEAESFVAKMTVLDPGERPSVNLVEEQLTQLYIDVTGDSYPLAQPRVEHPEELGDYIFSILADPSSVFNDVTRLCPAGSFLAKDWAIHVQDLYASLFGRHQPAEAARVSALLQIVFSRALNDGYVVPLEELDSIARSAEVVMRRFSGIPWPAFYSVEFASAAIPLLTLVSELNILDEETSKEVDDILENLVRLNPDRGN